MVVDGPNKVRVGRHSISSACLIEYSLKDGKNVTLMTIGQGYQIRIVIVAPLLTQINNLNFEYDVFFN